ncbi:unnamed protein product, partial [marine sediment metagenome]
MRTDTSGGIGSQQEDPSDWAHLPLVLLALSSPQGLG